MEKSLKTFYYLFVLLFFMSSMVYGDELHEAAAKGDLLKIKQLLEEGKDINSFGGEPGRKSGYPRGTPLHWAVKSGQEDVVLFLIKNGAAINATTIEGTSPMVETALDYAVWKRNIKLARILLDAGADVEGAGHEFHWPLMAAIVNEDMEMVQLLLDYGADIYRVGVDEYTVLHKAVLNEKIKSINFLLSIGFNVNAPRIGANGGTALYVAARNGNVEIGKILINHGADLNIINYQGHTPLYASVDKNNVQFAELLIQHGAGVNECGANVPDTAGYRSEYNPLDTPLHIAAKKGYLHLVKILIYAGADMNLKNRQGKTPIDIAKENGHTSVVSFLEENAHTSQTLNTSTTSN